MELNVETPKSLGYFMPAEWTKHEACWMAWPNDPIAWRGKHEEAKKIICDLANTISRYETVNFLVPNSQIQLAKTMCNKNINIIEIDINDSWARDTAPTFLINNKGNIAGVNWRFNGWGNMDFANYNLDENVALKVCENLSIPCFSAPLFNEGGAIHVDGEGSVLCTKSTLLNKNRNPDLNITEVENILKEYLGIEKVLWLESGYEDDETGGHIDVIASYVAPGKIMHLKTEDKNDPNYKTFNKNIESLKGMTDAKGRNIEVIEVPQPSKRFDGNRRLSLSYLNFYFVNGAVIVPTFNDEKDKEVLEIFKLTFPNREIVGFNASLIFHGGGGIHCVTQQQPKI